MNPFEKLLETIDVVDALRAEARIATAFGDPNDPREGETWNVDLEKARFEFLAGKSVLFAGPCQLFGTWARTDGFLWGRDNPSVAPSGTTRLFTSLAAMPELAPALATRKIKTKLQDVSLVANAFATRAGFTGVFSAPRGDAVALLAVDITSKDAEGVGHEPWCTSCGRLRRAVTTLVAGPGGVALCNVCAKTLGDMLDEDGERPKTAPPTGMPPVFSFCLFCGERKGGLIMTPAMGVCRECAAIMVDVCKE